MVNSNDIIVLFIGNPPHLIAAYSHLFKFEGSLGDNDPKRGFGRKNQFFF